MYLVYQNLFYGLKLDVFVKQGIPYAFPKSRDIMQILN